MKIIDSHSHIYLSEFSEDLPDVIDRAKKNGISQILLPNIDSSTINRMTDVCNMYPEYCYPMIGLHPTSVKENYKEELIIVEEQLDKSNRYIAVGEIGLDLYWDTTFLKEQMDAFDKQLSLALKYNLPVSIHIRDAFEQVYEILAKYKKTSLKGVFHSFTGTFTEAERLMEFTNFQFGINGVVTFKNSTLSQTLRIIPAERIILETDAPYLTPVPYRGKRNESSYLLYILKTVAGVYELPIEKMAEITNNTTLHVFERLK